MKTNLRFLPTPTPKPITFPHIMVRNGDHNFIVLITELTTEGFGKGIVLQQGSSGYKVGYYMESWNISGFVSLPNNREIALSND